MVKKSVIIPDAVFLFLGCGKPKPTHSYVFESYTTTDDGTRAYVFESDEMEGSMHVHYIATCDGHVTKTGADGDCRAITRYLHAMLPPAYLTSQDEGEHMYMEIPSLNLEFTVEEGY